MANRQLRNCPSAVNRTRSQVEGPAGDIGEHVGGLGAGQQPGGDLGAGLDPALLAASRLVQPGVLDRDARRGAQGDQDRLAEVSRNSPTFRLPVRYRLPNTTSRTRTGTPRKPCIGGWPAGKPDDAGCVDMSARRSANRMVAMGVEGGNGVAILARNHRWFVIANYAAARVGARIVLLNTEFSGPQIADVSDREGARLLIYDDEYAQVVSQANFELGRLRALGTNPDAAGSSASASGEDTSGATDETLAEVIARSSREPAPKPTKHSSLVILTSGTTGTPKGATRHAPPTLAPIGGILSAVPFKSGEVTSLPSPMFHALGYLHGTIAMTLGSTLLLRRRFRPLTVVEDIEKYGATALVVVPVMLSRILDALDER